MATRPRTEHPGDSAAPPLDSLSAVKFLLQANAELKTNAKDPKGVTLSQAEVQLLTRSIDVVLETFQQAPLSRGDLMAVMEHMINAGEKKTVSRLHPQAAVKASPAQNLPHDILLLIVSELREGRDILRDGEEAHLQLKDLARVSKAWRRSIFPLYSSEKHINETKHYPTLVKHLSKHPSRAEHLSSLFIRIQEYEFRGGVSSDAGFSLPDLLRLLPNLQSLSITFERSSTFARRRNPRENRDLDAFTGGLHLADAVASRKTLRQLIFGLPVCMSDLALFSSSLPQLHSLRVTGDVDDTPPLSPFRPCSSRLLEFWVPNAFLSAAHLNHLFPTARIQKLAFTFDVEDYFAPVPPTEEAIQDHIDKLVKVFERLGPTLKSLSLAAPSGDLQEQIRVRVPGNRAGGMGQQIQGIAGNIVQIALQAMGPLPPVNPPQGAQGGAQAGGVVGGAGGAGGAGAGAGAGGGMGGLVGVLPGMAGMPGFVLAFGNPPPPMPFFESVVALCPLLNRLELYGRRYSSSLITTIRCYPLEELTLSVPISEEERLETFDSLINILEEEEDEEEQAEGGTNDATRGLAKLKKLALFGDWVATERRVMKGVCDRRVPAIAYSSTGTNYRN